MALPPTSALQPAADPGWVRFVDMTYMPPELTNPQMAPCLPIVGTDFTVQRPNHPPIFVKLDTGFGGELLLSRTRLRDDFKLELHRSGLKQSPAKNVLIPNGSSKVYRTAFGESRSLDLFQAKLWLISNQDEFQGRSVVLPLAEGLAVAPEAAKSRRKRILECARTVIRGRDPRIDPSVNLIGRSLFLYKNIRLELQYPPANTHKPKAIPRLVVWVRPAAISPV